MHSSPLLKVSQPRVGGECPDESHEYTARAQKSLLWWLARCDLFAVAPTGLKNKSPCVFLAIVPVVFQNKNPFSCQTLLKSHEGLSWRRKCYHIELHSIFFSIALCWIALHYNLVYHIFGNALRSGSPQWWRCRSVIDTYTRDITKEMGKRCIMVNEQIMCVKWLQIWKWDTSFFGLFFGKCCQKCSLVYWDRAQVAWYEAHKTNKAHFKHSQWCQKIDLVALNPPQTIVRRWHGPQNLSATERTCHATWHTWHI